MPVETSVAAMGRGKRKKPRRLRGLVLFVTAFGLTISVVFGFYLGYLSGRCYGYEHLTGVLGAVAGFLVGLTGLIFLAKGES